MAKAKRLTANQTAAKLTRMAAKKVIRKRVKKAKPASQVLRLEDVKRAMKAADEAAQQSFLDEPRYSINQLNEVTDQFSKQAAEVMAQTHDDAVHQTHVNNFLAIARHMPGNAAVFLQSADTMRALKKELERLGYEDDQTI
jgi:hypothetical protein